MKKSKYLILNLIAGLLISNSINTSSIPANVSNIQLPAVPKLPPALSQQLSAAWGNANKWGNPDTILNMIILCDAVEQLPWFMKIFPNYPWQSRINTVLQWAVQGGANCLSYLLKHIPALRTNINADIDGAGVTPLMFALFGYSSIDNQIANLKLLLAYGANPTLKSKQGQTALTLAEKSNNKSAASVILQALKQS